MEVRASEKKKKWGGHVSHYHLLMWVVISLSTLYFKLNFLCEPNDDFLFLDSNSNSNSNPIPHRGSLAHDSKESRDYVNRLIGLTLSKYFNNDPPNKYWIPQ